MRDYSVALTGALDAELREHLVREDGEEDLLFTLYTPSRGRARDAALLHTPLFPEPGDRQRHGNVSFNRAYLERACREALRQGYGVAFLHSHPVPGWQGMSDDDVRAEARTARTVEAVTGLPLVGLTIGSDGTWSARAWERADGVGFEPRWCESVRVVGGRLRAHFADALVPRPAYRELFKRTLTVWGEASHHDLVRLRVGIVGLGSVGSLVAEALARMGLTRITLIDFDLVKPHNLDRLLGATGSDVGSLKVAVAKRQLERAATAASLEVRAVPYSVAEEAGYRAALDCDAIVCCVDRPRARGILNHFAYAHLISVVDGGIDARFKEGHFSGVDWQLQTVGPGRACLECLGRFDPADVETERAGLLDDPSYLRGLPKSHRFKRNENVFPFSMNLASLEVLQLVALITGAAGMTDFGVQRYRYLPGILESDTQRRCRDGCFTKELVASGDTSFTLAGRDLTAERVRREAEAVSGTPPADAA